MNWIIISLPAKWFKSIAVVCVVCLSDEFPFHLPYVFFFISFNLFFLVFVESENIQLYLLSIDNKYSVTCCERKIKINLNDWTRISVINVCDMYVQCSLFTHTHTQRRVKWMMEKEYRASRTHFRLKTKHSNVKEKKPLTNVQNKRSIYLRSAHNVQCTRYTFVSRNRWFVGL